MQMIQLHSSGSSHIVFSKLKAISSWDYFVSTIHLSWVYLMHPLLSHLQLSYQRYLNSHIGESRIDFCIFLDVFTMCCPLCASNIVFQCNILKSEYMAFVCAHHLLEISPLKIGWFVGNLFNVVLPFDIAYLEAWNEPDSIIAIIWWLW